MSLTTSDCDAKYERLLKSIGSLSNLFSDNDIPYINYRVVENIFCYCYYADNLSRTDTAYDARIKETGIGIKTFIMPRDSSIEKIAEFDRLSHKLSHLRNMELAQRVSQFRNDRILLANSLYGIKDAKYHIVARRRSEILIFETDYNMIPYQELSIIEDNGKIIRFKDKINQYSFNRSKSTLYRKFILPSEDRIKRFPVTIMEDPYNLLEKITLIETNSKQSNKSLRFGIDFIVLPLYSPSSKEKIVSPKSGLNMWNAGGRARKPGELYIPIPKKIHHLFPGFFPARHKEFNLITPSKEVLTASICQDGGKALMTNPNDALEKWLLRKIFKLKEGELLTKEIEAELSFDSVYIFKENDTVFKIDKAPYNSYQEYMESYL